jgi:hypothetical protein
MSMVKQTTFALTKLIESKFPKLATTFVRPLGVSVTSFLPMTLGRE